MSVIKIIIVGILLLGVGNAYAWDSEGGYESNESMDLEFVEGYNYFIYTTPEKPNWYDPIIDLWIRITSFLITDEEVEVTVTTTCMKWDGDSYEIDTDTLPEEYGMTLDMSVNQTGTTNIKVDPVEEFFKNNTGVIEDFKTREDDPEHPDILNVTVDITGAGVDVHETGYTSLDDEALDGIEEGITNPDYGFALGGRGSDGSSGSIYEGINMYAGTGDETGMGKGFGWIFFGLIPIIFIFAILKFTRRILGD